MLIQANGSVELSDSQVKRIEVNGRFAADCDIEADQIQLRGNLQFRNVTADKINLAGKVSGNNLKGENVVIQISSPSVLATIEADTVMIYLERGDTCQNDISPQLNLKKICCKAADIKNVHCGHIQAENLIVRGRSIIGAVDCPNIQKDETAIIDKS